MLRPFLLWQDRVSYTELGAGCFMIVGFCIDRSVREQHRYVAPVSRRTGNVIRSSADHGPTKISRNVVEIILRFFWEVILIL